MTITTDPNGTCPEDDYWSVCPACASPIDYCQGHGEIGDPWGNAVLVAHDADDHSDCHPDAGCGPF